MDTDEESERLAWDLEQVPFTRRAGIRSSKHREAVRKRFMAEQAERRLAACAKAVTQRAARRVNVWTLIVALLSFLILTVTSLPSVTNGLH